MRYGYNLNKAEIAGLLHDCAKHFEDEEIIRKCKKHKIPLTEDELKAPAVLHAFYGAWLAEFRYGVKDPEILSAIRWHTTGKADMTLLEKIIYIADYIEPNRDFEGVEELRRLAYEDLDRALLLGVETTIQEMRDRRLPIHTNTLRARDWLREHGTKTEE